LKREAIESFSGSGEQSKAFLDKESSIESFSGSLEKGKQSKAFLEAELLTK